MMSFRVRPLLAGLALLGAGGAPLLAAGAVTPGGKPAPVPPDHPEQMARGMQLFATRVRPVFLARCVTCHGGARKMAGFDLTTRDALLKGGGGGSAIVPGRARNSRLYRLISGHEKPAMPMGAVPLTADQVRDVAAWIDAGAPYDRPLLAAAERAAGRPMQVTDQDRQFWSFRPLQTSTPPAVKQPGWCRTPIDRFILGKLEEKGLAPNGPAARRTLVRRAYFDLIGLPPPPEVVDRFVTDPDPEAWPKLIDRLLADPHYGERWARHWLDLARYAESHGFEHDYDRPNAYHYRDFVIRAFNQDLPYNTFVSWQLAGDELAPENPEAMAATGFLAAGVHSTQITKSQVEKERYDELDDMTRTTGTAMLGLTVGCARCHDHKYDPIPTRDYYRLLSTFTTTVRSDFGVPVPDPSLGERHAAWERQRSEASAEIRKFDRERLSARMDRWLTEALRPAFGSGWTTPEQMSARSTEGATLSRQPDDSFLVSGAKPDHDRYEFQLDTHRTGITALRVEALADPGLVAGGPGRGDNGNFALSVLRVTAAPLGGSRPAVPVRLVGARATFEQPGLPVRAAIDDDPGSAWAVDPQFGKSHAAVFEPAAPIGFPGGTRLVVRMEFNTNVRHSIGRPRLSLAAGNVPSEIAAAPVPERVARVLGSLRVEPASLSPDDRQALLAWFGASDPERKRLMEGLAQVERSEPHPAMAKMLICSEGVPPLRLHSQGADFLEQTHFLKRGDPNQKDGVATQGFLQVMMRDPTGEKRWVMSPPSSARTSFRRTSLAHWMTDVDRGAGPLLARVIVNRLWQHHFGQGIVRTPSDFGFQGERPTHPELLEWMAGELVRNGWRLKPIQKLIMTSAVYLEEDRPSAKTQALDPDDRLRWRQAPRRLEAEAIRDTLLSVSGTLDPTMFGPGTLDEAMKRRSIYFMVKRSRLVPSMVLFDAPDALQGLDRRVTTTIAPQALLLLNNRIVRDHAEAFARRIAPSPGATPETTVQAGYRLALGRDATSDELAASTDFLRQQAQSYRMDGKPEPDHRAVSDFCQALFGLDEFVYVD